MYAVEARIYPGCIVHRVRPAKPGEVNSRMELDECIIWIDVFDDEAGARKFDRGYQS